MKVPRNFEGVFLTAVAISTFAAYATADEPAVAAPVQRVQASAVAQEQMQVVVVKAKRLSAAEKAALD